MKHLDLLHVKNKQLLHNTIKNKFCCTSMDILDGRMMTTTTMGNQIIKSMLDGDEAKTRRDGIALLL